MKTNLKLVPCLTVLFFFALKLSAQGPCSNPANVPTITLSPDTVSFCEGASVNPFTVTASGANTYSWNTGITTSTLNVTSLSHTYIVHGTNTSSGCTASKTLIININPLPVPTISNPNPTLCAGKSTTLTASGAPNYFWSTGINGASVAVSPTASIIYSVASTSSANCTGYGIIQIIVNPLPLITTSVSIPSVCAGETTTLSASGASTYTWFTANGNLSQSSVALVSPTISMTYSVSGANSLGCEKTSSVLVSVNLCTGLSNLEESGIFKLFPNPSTNGFYIESNEVNDKISSLKIYSLIGEKLAEIELLNKSTFVETHLASGIYYYEISQSKNKTITKGKLVIE